jgi:outer membrane receptor for ferrienterochelin and colicins
MQDPDAYGQTSDFSYSIGMQYSTNINAALFNNSKMIMGIENNNDKLIDKKLGTVNYDNITVASQLSNTVGMFLQNEWELEKLKFLIGFRFDNYLIRDELAETNKDIIGSVLVPRANLLYKFNNNLQYRLSYATGYRAPQIFDEDLHIEANGARKIIHTNSDDLIQETSNSITSSFDYSKEYNNVFIDFLVEGFYTILNNPFANEYITNDSNNTVEYRRINATSGAFVYGINLEINFAYKKINQLSSFQ